MEFKFKYWGNSGGRLYVQEFFCETYEDLKNAVQNLIKARPDIDNIEVYLAGKIVTSLYNIKRNIVGRSDMKIGKKLQMVP